ncbi:hypothetical protein OfM1_03640 [Lactovum odontotermitis]
MSEKFECLEGFETLSNEELAEVNGGTPLEDILASFSRNSNPFVHTFLNGAAWNNGRRPPQANYFPEYNLYIIGIEI